MNLTGYIIISLLGATFFAGMETAFVTANRLKFELSKTNQSVSTYILSVFYNNPQQFIATMFVGKLLSIIIYAYLSYRAISPVFETVMHPAFAYLLLILTVATILIIVGEFLSKSIFSINPNLWLRFFSWLLIILYVVIYPISWVSSRFSMWLFQLIYRTSEIPKSVEENVFSGIDLNYLLRETDTNEKIVEQNKDVTIFKNALDFSNVRLRDCMIPRTEIVALEYGVNVNALKQTFIETGLSKILIYKEDIDNIIGYIHSSEMFQYQKGWEKHIRTIPIVPETMAAQKLMKKFMQQKKTIAVVVDEFGGTAGLVTLEDIIEEIFGDIEDEHDFKEYTAEMIAPNEYLFAGRLEVEEANRLFNLNIPTSDDYSTIAGFILNAHQKFPKLNEVIRIDKFTFKCSEVTNNRIKMVKMQQNI